MHLRFAAGSRSLTLVSLLLAAVLSVRGYVVEPGAFSSYATDTPRAVVLRWPDRAVVVAPDEPESFATAAEAAAGLS